VHPLERVLDGMLRRYRRFRGREDRLAARSASHARYASATSGASPPRDQGSGIVGPTGAVHEQARPERVLGCHVDVLAGAGADSGWHQARRRLVGVLRSPFPC